MRQERLQVSTYGWIEARNVQGIIPEFSSVSGDIILDGANFASAAVFSAVNGMIVGNEVSFESGVNISAVSGAIIMQNSTFGGTANLSAVNGELRSASNRFLGTANLSTVNGSPFSDNDSFAAMNISTVNGNAVVSLAQPAQNYNIIISSMVGGLFYNNTQIGAEDLKTNASTRINFSSVIGSLEIFD